MRREYRRFVTTLRLLNHCNCSIFAGLFFLLTFSAHGWVTFTDVTEQAGIRFQHVNSARGEELFPEAVGSGAVLFDYDKDGWLDIYLVNAGDCQGEGAADALYRNNGGDGTFTDVTEKAGVGDKGYGDGAVAGDYDGDGWEDLYVCNFKRNTLYRNNGDGTFTDVTEKAGVGETRWSTVAIFTDIENDGDLDLYVGNYVRYDRAWDSCSFRDIHVTCGPETFDPETDTLYQNNGDGTFTDISKKAGVVFAGRALAVIAGDYDDDGDSDIFVANDMNPNFLYRNRGDGTFEEVGTTAGVALAEDATMGNSMGVDLADFDNDGGLDLIFTNFQDQVNTLYHNDRDGFFTDVSYASGTGVPSLPLLAWAVNLTDFDNDGWRDLFVINGHIHYNIEQFDDVGTYAQPILLFRNEGGGTFAEMSKTSGEAITTPRVGRGAAFGDFDNDGDTDVVINNLRGSATLLRNDGGNANGWARVVVTPPSRAIGARVWCETTPLPSPPSQGGERKGGGLKQMDEIQSGGSYASHNDTRPLFGIGKATSAKVWVEWKDGKKSAVMDVSPGQTVEAKYPE